MKTKTETLRELLAKGDALRTELEASDDDAVIAVKQTEFDGILDEIISVQAAIAKEAALKSARDFLETPEGGSKTAGLFTPAGGDGANAQPWAPDLGELFTELDTYKAGIAANIPRGTEVSLETKGFLAPAMIRQQFERMQRKATFTSSGLTSIMRVPGIIELGTLRLTVADLLAVGQTDATTIRYMQEVNFANAAAIVPEGTPKPEATFNVVEKDAPVRKIAVTAKVTDELFKDYPAMRDYVNNRLRLMVQITEEQQLLNGLGTGSEIQGILNTPGIQVQSAIGDLTLGSESILKAADKVRTGAFLEPDGIVCHPNDYQKIRLTQDANKQYYAGGPFFQQYGNGGYVMNPPLWGLPVVATPAIVAGMALVGAFKTGAQVFYREGITLDMTNSNVDDFVKNLLTLRCEERLALAVYRPKAFCQVTGIGS